jgi:hypothetical protein
VLILEDYILQGVFHGSKSGSGYMRRKGRKRFRRYLTMKSILMVALMAVAVLLMAPSCATVSTKPLGPGEVKLLGINIPEVGDLAASLQYPVNISFEADGRPEMTRACFSWSGDGPTCLKVRDVNYGSGTIKVDFRSNRTPGVYLLEAYVLYIKDGRTTRTNSVSTRVTVIFK